jgi:hypothetical protein
MENMLGNTSGIWGRYWELDGNTLGTWRGLNRNTLGTKENYHLLNRKVDNPSSLHGA